MGGGKAGHGSNPGTCRDYLLPVLPSAQDWKGHSAFAEPCLGAMAGGAKVCDKMLSEFDTGLNEISPGGEVTVEFAECLASCGSAPVMLVDDELHENLDEEKAKAICDQIKSETVQA